DAWSLINESGATCLVGAEQNGYALPIEHWLLPDYGNPYGATEEAISYAVFRILLARYQNAPGYPGIVSRATQLMNDRGFDPTFTDTDYKTGNPAALGNYLAAQILAYGMQDGSNEVADYANATYPAPFNQPLQFENPFSIFRLVDPNRWQSLLFPGVVIDQSGNVIGGDGPLPFLGAEWGKVTPFALSADDRTIPGEDWYGDSPIYHDPGPPPLYSRTDEASLDEYRWGFELVLKWSSHLDPADGVMWDISPGARGNFQGEYPTAYADYDQFYKVHEGGTFNATGHDVNPATGEPYAPNMVPRGDYTRVLAEFWADGPESETPPGHWFAIFNEAVLDHPDFERRLAGEGSELDPLEYEVKAYLALGGALHDAAITAWSIKGAYDYVRPISAIRFMAKNGQATDPNLPNYNQFGLKLDSGYIETIDDFGVIENTTTLATVKARGWIGPEAIDDPATDVAGVGWINPTMWYPYQRPTFVTPNFAGYVSGHSTYSAAAATVLEKITGSAYFPGGMAEFVAEKDSFLVFEEGPSQDIVLQWATYRDASDQTSLSRIWGGIHPPADDIPGRVAGTAVGEDAFVKAMTIFDGDLTSLPSREAALPLRIYPNPVHPGAELRVDFPTGTAPQVLRLFDATGRVLRNVTTQRGPVRLSTENLVAGLYFLKSTNGRFAGKFVVR
ncbi:MAG: DUF6851 domain-containing protein, partial [Bacteroidota bacterium]